MKQALYALALLFCLFPYTQILEIESYNQPYALVFCGLVSIVAIPLVTREFPRTSLTMLVILAISGFCAFLISCLPQPNTQEFKYLLIYISPLVFAVAGFAIVREYPSMADHMIVAASMIWIIVGLIQTVVDPSFMTQFVGGIFEDTATNVVDSGRGTLGLAPEPTHFGFHMMILAAMLCFVGGRNLLAIGSILAALVIARSSSAFLAIALGSLIYVVIYGRRWRILLVSVIPIYYLIGALLNLNLLPDDWRLIQLMSQFYAEPFYLITSDASANARLGGIWVGLQEILRNGLLPAGLSHEKWMASIGPAMARNPWLIFLSEAGMPSGFLIVVYQLGVIGLILVIIAIAALAKQTNSHMEAFIVSTILFVFASQYYLSTPGLGLLIGISSAKWFYLNQVTVGARFLIENSDQSCSLRSKAA